MFMNFDSVIYIHVIMMKSYVDGLFNSTGVQVRVVTIKLNLFPNSMKLLLWRSLHS